MNYLRYAFRVLAKSPMFTAIAVFTLALGVGVNSGIFSIVDAVVFRPLPYPNSDRLVSLWTRSLPNQPQNLRASGDTLGGSAQERFTVSPANLMDYRKAVDVFSGIAGFGFIGKNLTDSGPPERLFGEKVTTNYFKVLGVRPAQGRDFWAEEERPGNDQVVIITHELWKNRFSSNPDLLGHQILLDQQSFRVIGIMPPGFKSPNQLVLPEELSFFVPAAYSAAQLADRTTFELNVIARLQSGATIRQAQAEMDAISGGLEQRFPETNRNIRAGLARLDSDIRSNARPAMLALLGAVGLILLIACANLANLLLARGLGRRREIAIRFALGASRASVITELLTQSAMLAGLGFIAGLALGEWTRQLLVKFAPAGIPRLDTAMLDTRVILFTALLSLAAAILFGLFPAWQASKTSPSTSLKASERGIAAPAVMRSRNALMVAEIGLSMMLLVGAGLLLRSFVLLSGVDVGFESAKVVAMNVNLPPAHYQNADQRFAFFEDLADRVASLPGVEAAAFANRMPVRGGWTTSVQVDDAPDQRNAEGQAVSTGYFQTLGIPLLRGRLFTRDDRKNALPVGIVNSAFARSYLAGKNAVGHRFRFGPNTPWLTIAGMVADVHRGGKSASAGAQIYLPAAQTDVYPVRLADFAFRTKADPKGLIASVQRQVWAIDKDQPVTRIGTLDEMIATAVAPRRFEALLIAMFAGLALALALVGVYGVVSYGVSQRTGEIGLRIALGASRGDILRMLVCRSVTLIAAGVAAGAGGAYGLARYLASLLFEVKPYDPITYVSIAGILTIVALAACSVPARRATRIDPMVALRYD